MPQSCATPSSPKLEGLSLFFPCYNEEANVEKTIQEALQTAPEVALRFEIIIVDDGSRDRTPDIVRRIAETEPRVRLVRHERNQGYGEALKSGFRSATLPWIFYSDGDGQFELKELSTLVKLSSEADIVSGYRIKRADPWHRLLNAHIFSFCVRLFMGLHIRDVDCAFKLYRKTIFDRIRLITTGAMIDTEILVKAQRLGYRIQSIGVTHRPRRQGVQTGAKPGVVLKAMREFWYLWNDLRRS